MEKKTAVLFVCLGNICRSPLAEGLFLQALEERGLAHLFEVDSCGTSGQHDGELPDRRTRQNALSHGVALTHSSRRIRPRDLAHFDRILVMDDDDLVRETARIMLRRLGWDVEAASHGQQAVGSLAVGDLGEGLLRELAQFRAGGLGAGERMAGVLVGERRRDDQDLVDAVHERCVERAALGPFGATDQGDGPVHEASVGLRTARGGP